MLILLPIPLHGVRYAMRKKKSTLTTYSERRTTRKSGEPKGTVSKKTKAIFVVQKHKASHLHYDFRLAIDGALVSWAIPKGPPRRAGIKRLAVHTDDHPMAYADFEGTIPEGNYGAGTVTIWDRGSYSNTTEKSMQEQLKSGQLEFELYGDLLRGVYVLVHTQAATSKWLLIKKRKKARL